MLILRWRAFSHMVEGTDVPRAVSREAGWMPIQMPLELGSCPPPLFFKREEVENKCHQLLKNTHRMGTR